jgi:predicted MFS family arabinose efflux permease
MDTTGKTSADRINRVLIFRLIVSAVFLITFQAYMAAPLSPALSVSLKSNVYVMGLAIPLFAVSYGISAMLYGWLLTWYDRKKLLFALIAGMALGILLMPLSNSAVTFLVGRSIIGAITGGIIPIGMSLIGDLYSYKNREKPFALLFMTIAAGMTFGPTFGAYMNPLVGWQWEYLIVGLLALIVFIYGLIYFRHIPPHKNYAYYPVAQLRKRFRLFFKSSIGKKTYAFIFLTAIFHSGLFVWISFYFNSRYHFNDPGTGWALLLFSLPGLLLSVSISIATERFGRREILGAGLCIVTATVFILNIYTSFWISVFAVALLSTGFVMTQPLYTGIVRNLRNGQTSGLTVGLGTGLLFLGYGAGPVFFQLLLRFNTNYALSALAVLEVLLFLCSLENYDKKTLADRTLKRLFFVQNRAKS